MFKPMDTKIITICPQNDSKLVWIFTVFKSVKEYNFEKVVFCEFIGYYMVSGNRSEKFM